MPTQTASGHSSLSTTEDAIREAIGNAVTGLQMPATAGFLFASSKHDLQEALRHASHIAPGCEFIACQSAGEITDKGLTHGGVSVLLTTLNPELFSITATGNVRTDPTSAGQNLTATFGDLQSRATHRGAALSTTVLLVDALSGTGERIVKEVLHRTRLFQQVVGGAAGDDGRFQTPQVGSTQFAGIDAAAALHVFGTQPWGVGVAHGLAPQTKPMVVTRAQGNVVYEIDRKPAIEAYRTFAKTKGIELTDENIGAFLIGNQLGVFFLNELHHARAPVGVGDDGELKLVAEIAPGAQVCILDGEAESMVAACARAAESALANLHGASPAGVLVFDCICREMILKEEFQRGLDAIARYFPRVPMAGFLSYGEIARFRGKLDGWHNTTTVVVALPS